MDSEDKKNSVFKELMVSIPLILLFFFIVKKCGNDSYNERINNYTGETIGYATRFVKSGKNSSLKFFYFVNGEKIINADRFATYYNSSSKKFYRVKYNINDPKESLIVLEDTLIPDTTALFNLGFKKVKKYYYDHITSTYKEKTEWE